MPQVPTKCVFIRSIIKCLTLCFSSENNKKVTLNLPLTVYQKLQIFATFSKVADITLLKQPVTSFTYLHLLRLVVSDKAA